MKLLRSSGLSINAPSLLLKNTWVKIPLNPGYLPASLPPKINLKNLMEGWVTYYNKTLGSSSPNLVKPIAFFSTAL